MGRFHTAEGDARQFIPAATTVCVDCKHHEPSESRSSFIGGLGGDDRCGVSPCHGEPSIITGTRHEWNDHCAEVNDGNCGLFEAKPDRPKRTTPRPAVEDPRTDAEPRPLEKGL